MTNMQIDFHSHVLPKADHGCHSSEMASHQLAIIKNGGTTHLVATPHFEPMSDRVSSFLRRRAIGEEKLRRFLTPDMPEVYIGAEVLLCEGMEKMPDLDKLCIRGTKTLLLERPFLPLTDALAETVYEIASLGFQILLAHVDRYAIHETCSLLLPNIHAQINSTALRFPWQRRRYAPLFRDGMVAALGSDLHGEPKQYNGFGKLPKLLGDRFPEIMSRSAKLLDGAVSLQENSFQAP